jgi:hypothetical protein
MPLIKYLSGNNTNCPWHKDDPKEGREYLTLLNQCPFAFHSLYPYFLGFVFGANYGKNVQGDCQVCCPAEKGVDFMVKKRPYEKRFGPVVPTPWRDVIHAEVITVNGPCEYKYEPGEIIFFPTFNKEDHMCPAGLFNLFPFLNFPVPACINKSKLRCPDWNENVYYSIGE